jgi:hypothetical protein
MLEFITCKRFFKEVLFKEWGCAFT